MSSEFPWRLAVPSLTYLETSTLWRQEHNGFSHQSPGFINSLLNKKKDIMRIYLPPDAYCLLSTFDHCLAGVNHVNLVIANKQPTSAWLTLEEAIAHSPRRCVDLAVGQHRMTAWRPTWCSSESVTSLPPKSWPPPISCDAKFPSCGSAW
jgi:hypothetical protein